jgi:hypothetical protein
VSGAVVLVARVGGADGSLAAAAALACAGSDQDRAGLLVDLADRRPRPALLASTAARRLEERLAAHLPEAPLASRGQVCHLSLPADGDGIDRLPAALPLARDAIAVLHLPPDLLRAVLGQSSIRASGVLLRADLGRDRALTALAVRDLLDRGLAVAVLKRPLAWVQSRRALFGLLPGGAAAGLPPTMEKRLLASRCYDVLQDEEADPTRAAQQQRRGDEGTGRRRGLRRHPQWDADW